MKQMKQYYEKDASGNFVEVPQKNITILDTTEYIRGEQLEDIVPKNIDGRSAPGSILVERLWDFTNRNFLNTSVLNYQREEVADIEWSQGIIDTLLFSDFKRIPSVHIRVVTIKKNDTDEIVKALEVTDGQQRTRAGVLNFLNDEVPIKDNRILPNGIDVSGKYFSELKTIAPDLYHKVLTTRLDCVWYINISDEEVSELFTDVLNNVNNMVAQEKRNAVRGYFTDYIRDRARATNSDSSSQLGVHDLFQRTTKGNTTRLTYFPEITLKNRMEADALCAVLCYVDDHQWTNGFSNKNLDDWYRTKQRDGGDWNRNKDISVWMKSQSKFEEMLDFALELMKLVPKEHLVKLKSANSVAVFIGHARVLSKYAKLDKATYVKSFFKTWTDWSSTTKKKYTNHTYILASGKPSTEQLKPFNEIFGGSGKKAMMTIQMVLNLAGDGEYYGVIELDSRSTFSPSDINQVYSEQNGKCFYTGDDLKYEDRAGDHFIPHAWGLKRGGVTEVTNLRVTSKSLNRTKSDKSPEDFAKELKEKGLNISEEFQTELNNRAEK